MSLKNTIFVIGSGPAGIAAASALLARGLKITMIDVGNELENDIQKKLQHFQNTQELAKLEELKYELSNNDSIKLSYGSDFVYRQNGLINFITDKKAYCMPSLAKGGLSNIWGAFIDSYTGEDLIDWPFNLDSLKPYYQQVLQFLPLASQFKSSQQAQYLINHYSNYGEKLSHYGFQYGKAQLAVSFGDSEKSHCTYCGMCQYGCPNFLIYNATQTLKKLKENENFEYLDQLYTQKIEENDKEVIIHGLTSHSKEKFQLKGTQVFLACGSIFSTIILMNSLKHYNEPITLLDSQHFMIPCILFKKIDNPKKEKLHTLCQLYLKLKYKNVIEKYCHLQIYTYMDFFEKELKKKFGKIYGLVEWFLAPLLSRLIVIQGFLDSKDSSQFTLQIDENEILVKVNEVKNKKTSIKIKQIISYLTKMSPLLKFFPIRCMLKISKVGRSYHYGGSFPMSENPKRFQTDKWGRLTDFKRLNVVDGTVLPTIPAKSITFSIMANAYRIATECEIL